MTVGVENCVGVGVGVFVTTAVGVNVGSGTLVGVEIPAKLKVRLMTCPISPRLPRSCPL